MWTTFWESLALAGAGTLFLRLAGRKSLSQMTTPQLAILLAIGSILGSKFGSAGIWHSVLAAATFIAFLVAAEWITLRWNPAEIALKGRSIPVIENGQRIDSNLKQLRMSVDDLEKRLRIAGISRVADVKTGTIEVNGELGYELFPHAKPITRGDLEQLLTAYFPQMKLAPPSDRGSLFSEISTRSGGSGDGSNPLH